jgi:hypothetical protein
MDTPIGKDDRQPKAMEGTSEDMRPYAPCVTLEERDSSALGECYLLPAPLGLRPNSYDAMRRFLVDLISHFIVHRGCVHESYVALHQTRARATNELFQDHARDWLPEAVLGVWTHLPPPRMMTAEDLMEMDSSLSESIRMHTLFRVTTGVPACMDSMTTMAGTGTGIQVVSQMGAERLLNNWKDLFLDFIQERIYRIFPWYIPLLRLQSVEEPIADLSSQALASTLLYIRESPEDGGLLILSREPLEELFLRMGCLPVALTTGARQWTLPA